MVTDANNNVSEDRKIGSDTLRSPTLEIASTYTRNEFLLNPPLRWSQCTRQLAKRPRFSTFLLVFLVSTLVSTVTTPLLIYSLFSFTTRTYFSRNSSVSFDDKRKQSIRICHFGVCYFLSLALFTLLDQFFHSMHSIRFSCQGTNDVHVTRIEG